MICFSLINVPLLVKKYKGIYTLISFYLSLNLLLLSCKLLFSGNWFLISVVTILFSMNLIFLPFVLKALPLKKVKNHKALICLIVDSL